MKDVIPSDADWIQKKVVDIDPENNCVVLNDDEKVKSCISPVY